MIPTLFTLLGSIQILLSAHGAATNIDPALQKKIHAAPAGSTWNIIVVFKKDPSLQVSVQASVSSIKESHLKAYEILMKLEKAANESQRKVVDVVKNFQKGRQSTSGKVRLKTLWDHNDLLIDSASKELIDILGEDSKPENANITKIMEDEPFYVDTVKPLNETTELVGWMPDKATPLQVDVKEIWGHEAIKVHAWWKAKYNGTGVIIGHIDTGVDIRHPSLKWNWVGKGDGWLDPTNPTNTFPFEISQPSSPGTHHIGTIIGRGRGTSSEKESDVPFFGVGIAPLARWISCTVCRTSAILGKLECRGALLRECMMFMHCPNTENKCLYKPDVVATSIGCAQTATQVCSAPTKSLGEMISLWRSSGIIPVFAAGKGGLQGCTTLADPADHEDVITVGSVDRNDILDIESSKGPPLLRYNLSEVNARQIFKPTLVAPGTYVVSTIYTGPEAKFKFAFNSGTGIATAHVVGAIALLLSRTEKLTYEQVRNILLNSAVPNTLLKSSFPEEHCGGLNDSALANHKFGYGRLLLPDPNDKNLPEPRAPTREMPPPPDYSDLGSRSTKLHTTNMKLIILIIMSFVTLYKHAVC